MIEIDIVTHVSRRKTTPKEWSCDKLFEYFTTKKLKNFYIKKTSYGIKFLRTKKFRVRSPVDIGEVQAKIKIVESELGIARFCAKNKLCILYHAGAIYDIPFVNVVILNGENKRVMLGIYT
jgi:hypothetical protein